MSQEPEFVKIWDVSGGFMSPDDAQIMGALGLDSEGFLHVVASETESADETLEQICERVNGMRVIHVRKAAQDGSVLTSEAYVYEREEAGFDEAVERYLTNQEFLKLLPFSEEEA
ncbi:MAG: hypothetical protein KJ017_07965 [Alphaproteobacteria bacterium]|nr:hypothetical protein [Alphaproteobacteria bacterium]